MMRLMMAAALVALAWYGYIEYGGGSGRLKLSSGGGGGAGFGGFSEATGSVAGAAAGAAAGTAGQIDN